MKLQKILLQAGAVLIGGLFVSKLAGAFSSKPAPAPAPAPAPFPSAPSAPPAASVSIAVPVPAAVAPAAQAYADEAAKHAKKATDEAIARAFVDQKAAELRQAFGVSGTGEESHEHTHEEHAHTHEGHDHEEHEEHEGEREGTEP